MIGDFERHQNVFIMSTFKHLDEYFLQIIKELMIGGRFQFSGYLYSVNDQGIVFLTEIKHVYVAYPISIFEYPDIEETGGHELSFSLVSIGAVS